jgi:acetylornithine deacetylase/succinyl-diaminopimelate desuccinylase-like protein
LESSVWGQSLAEHYRELVSLTESQETALAHASGAADISHMSHKNAMALDGLGPVGGRLHTSSEYVELESLATRSYALEHFLVSVEQFVTKNKTSFLQQEVLRHDAFESQ